MGLPHLLQKCPKLDPRPTKPFFVTWFTKGGGHHPLMNLKLTGPKYNCLVPWYREGSPLSINTKIMKIGQRMTSQWCFQTWPYSKSGFSVKIDQNWKKIHFFAKKSSKYRNFTPFFAYKEGKWCCRYFSKWRHNILRWQPPPYLRTLTAHPTPF